VKNWRTNWPISPFKFSICRVANDSIAYAANAEDMYVESQSSRVARKLELVIPRGPGSGYNDISFCKRHGRPRLPSRHMTGNEDFAAHTARNDITSISINETCSTPTSSPTGRRSSPLCAFDELRRLIPTLSYLQQTSYKQPCNWYRCQESESPTSTRNTLRVDCYVAAATSR